MWLILCESDDLGALWVAKALKERGETPVELVTVENIAYSLAWEFHLNGMAGGLRIQLADGREIDSALVTGVLNRLHSLPYEHLGEVAGEDLDYCVQETHAFAMAWLQAFPIPVVNPPSASGLCGGYRHVSEWLALAVRSGLSIPDYLHRSECSGESEESFPELSGDEPTATVIVLEDAVFCSETVPDSLRDGCRKLATLAELPLLGATFTRFPGKDWLFVGATPTPDLKLAGPGFPEALIRCWESS